MAYGYGGGYGYGGYNPYMMEQARENPFFDPYSERPDYWGGIGSMLGNLWKMKQAREQQEYERAMAERKMAVEERQAARPGAGGTPSAFREKYDLGIQNGMSPQAALNFAAGVQPTKKTGKEEEVAMLMEAGYSPAEARKLAVLGREPQPKENTEETKLYTRQNTMVNQAATKLNVLLEGPSGIGKQLKDLENWGATYIDKAVPQEKRGTEAGLSVQTKRYRDLSRRVAVLQAAKERLNELQDKLARQETLTPDEEADVRTLLTRPESFMSPNPVGGAKIVKPSPINDAYAKDSTNIFANLRLTSPYEKTSPPPMAQQATPPLPPPAGTEVGTTAYGKRSGTTWKWNGKSWDFIK